MTITTNKEGFSEAKLMTENSACLWATTSSSGTAFEVAMTENFREESWHFDHAACIEAIEFFQKLADELERRALEAKPVAPKRRRR